MRRKSVFRWDSGGENPFETEKREGLDRVELRTWMENAPRNIPGIVWEQFSGSPRTTSAPTTVYKYRGGWSSADCNCTTESFFSSKGASITRDYPQTDSEGTVRTAPQTDWYKTGIPLEEHRRFIQDADGYCCRSLPRKPQRGECFSLSLSTETNRLRGYFISAERTAVFILMV